MAAFDLGTAGMAQALRRRPLYNPVSFTAPQAGPISPPQPLGVPGRAEALAFALKNSAPPDYTSVQSPLEGMAKALTSGLQGWEAGQVTKEDERKKSANAAMMADLLFPGGGQQADKFRQMYASGLIGSDTFAPQIAQNLGLGTPPAPIKMGKDDWFADPSTHLRIGEPPTADPVKPEYKEVNGRIIAIENGQARDITPADLPQGYRPATPEERAAYQVPEGTPLVIGPNGEPKTLGGTTVKVENNLGPTGVDYGDPPKDTTWARDAEGKVLLEPDPGGHGMRPRAVPIAGGPIEMKAAEDAAAAALRQGQKERNADVVVDRIDSSIADIEKNPTGTTGWGGAFLQYLPASEAQAIQQRLMTIKANIGFDRLASMRESNPNGAGLGQVSNFENQLLQATLGSLEQSQSRDELLYNLRRIRSLYNILFDNVTGGSEKTTALAKIGQAVDRGEMTAEQAGQMVEGILSTVPDSGWTALPGGARMREIK